MAAAAGSPGAAVDRGSWPAGRGRRKAAPVRSRACPTAFGPAPIRLQSAATPTGASRERYAPSGAHATWNASHQASGRHREVASGGQPVGRGGKGEGDLRVPSAGCSHNRRVMRSEKQSVSGPVMATSPSSPAECAERELRSERRNTAVGTSPFDRVLPSGGSERRWFAAQRRSWTNVTAGRRKAARKGPMLHASLSVVSTQRRSRVTADGDIGDSSRWQQRSYGANRVA